MSSCQMAQLAGYSRLILSASDHFKQGDIVTKLSDTIHLKKALPYLVLYVPYGHYTMTLMNSDGKIFNDDYNRYIRTQ